MNIRHLIPLLVAVVVMAVGTVYQGMITERWTPQTSEQLIGFTDNLAKVDATIGKWDSVETPLTAEEFAATNCTGYVSRIYKNRETGQEVSVYLVAGTARHITIHTPDWCYQGAGFEMEGKPNPYSVDCPGLPKPAEFVTTTFLKETATDSSRLRIFWSYSDDGNWLGPTAPKPFFMGRPALFKVYLITSATPTESDPMESASPEFAKVFMPELNRVLFETPSATESVATDGA